MKITSVREHFEKLMKYQVMVGVILVVFPMGIPWYYGNLATYQESYFRLRPKPSSSDVDGTWMLSAFFTGFISGQLLSRTISSKCGLVRTFVASNIVFDIGVLVTYFSVQHSMALTLFTFMTVPGLCSGVIFALSFAVVADWFRGKHVGVASSFVTVAFSTGAVVYNEVITVFVNPQNFAPSYTEGNLILFDQPEILDRYPFVFLVIGILSVAFQIIGTPLLKYPPPKTNATNEENVPKVCLKESGSSTNTHKEQSDSMKMYDAKIDTSLPCPLQSHLRKQSRGKSADQTIYDTFQSLTTSSKNTMPRHDNKTALYNYMEPDITTPQDHSNIETYNHMESTINMPRKGNNGLCYEDVKTNTITPQNDNNLINCNHLDSKTISLQDNGNVSVYNDMTCNITEPQSDKSVTIYGDMKPVEVFQTIRFHVLWFTSFSMAFGYLLVNNYYKLFGQLWIDDDNFLATIGSVSTMVGAGMRIAAGVSVDRIGLKSTTLSLTSTYIVLLSFWYLSVRVHPWFYMVVTNALSGVVSCAFIVFPLGMLQYFGHCYYPTNIGLLLASTLFSNLIAPAFFSYFLDQFGWFWLFVSISFMGPFVVFAQIIFMP